MAGMRDVAKSAGVALSTVSIVLNDGEKFVSPEIREKVLCAAVELGYNLPVKKEQTECTIAVLLPVITSVFFSNLLSGIENTVASEGYTLLFGSSGFDFERETRFVRTVNKQSLCGVIIDTVCPQGSEQDYIKSLRRKFVSKGVPVVFLERNFVYEDFYYIYVDHFHNAYLAVKHLIEKGHKRIAHISGSMCNQNSIDRLKGYRKALEEFNIPYDSGLVIEGDFTPNSGYISTKRLMGICSDFTALFSANDQMAVGAIKAIRSEGKRVPEDVAVVGIDNLSISSMINPSLTTINVPTYNMGHLAAQTIIDIHEGKECKQSHRLPCNLIVRKSTDPYADNDWELFGW